jgi:hypothetical protein
MGGPDQRFWPRLSEATLLLPLISAHLNAVASHHSVCATLELWPIVEDGLFGYELVPDRQTHTYLIVACNVQGEPVVRRTSYSAGAPDALQLVVVNGRLLSRSERAARYSTQRRDSVFPDWVAAAEAACRQLGLLFPEKSSEIGVPTERAHRYLEEALRIAHSHLARWDPFIQFFGLPNEAQMGYALLGADDEQGELIFRPPATWALRWTALDAVVTESWSLTLEEADSPGNSQGKPLFFDRRTRRRREADRGSVVSAWLGAERRHTRGRRTMD